MKLVVILTFLFLTVGCINKQVVYWCGDHACINKKEKEAYFKKTMIVETRKIDKKTNKDLSNLEKIKKNEGIISQENLNQETKLNADDIIFEKNEKQILKQAKLKEKNRIKNEKLLAKQARLEEKNRIKNEKLLAKQARLEQKNKIENNKKKSDQIQLEEGKTNTSNKINKEKVLLNKQVRSNEPSSVEFNEILKSIYEKNIEKSYPDINDIPK